MRTSHCPLKPGFVTISLAAMSSMRSTQGWQESLTKRCFTSLRSIVTFDEDLADARMFPLGEHHGIIRLRIWPTTTEATQEAFIRLREALPFADWRGNLIIIDNQQIRLRRKPPAH